ncbi:MAG: RagB/SusD family nutrient uptake outer membrane protein [Bacteroidales bacterium]|nr:RagB/SusD family nutrient uptake outer membrane protein [Bacteroidales bacterium]
MKKYILIIFILQLAIIACNDEDFLNQLPTTPSDGQFYTNPSGALQGLNAAYDILQLGEQVERTEFIGTVCSGDAMVGGEPGGNDQPPLQEIMKFRTLPSNSALLWYYRALYRGIYRCNLITDYLSDPSQLTSDFTNDLRLQIMGEAIFLRGLFHFKLQIMFGGYPQLQSDFSEPLKGIIYVDHVLLPDEWEQERPSLEYTWEKIEEDFLEASELLPEKDEYSSEDVGRATKGAALSMLAKTYLYQEKWADAYETARTVINSGRYWLIGGPEEPGPFTITRLAKEGNVQVTVPALKYLWQPEANNGGESIFDVQHYMEGSNRWPEGMEGNLIPRYYGPRSAFVWQRIQRTPGNFVDSLAGNEFFWGFILPTNYFVETAFGDIGCEVGGEIVDPRYTYWVMRETDSLPYHYTREDYLVNKPDSVMFNAWYNWPCTGYSTWKYFTDPSFDAIRNNMGDMPQTTKYFRYADLLLIGAEAAVHSGHDNDALTWVNMVRERARNSGNTGYPQDLTTVSLADIYAERRVELAFEGHQFYDIMRTGRAQQVLKEDALEYRTMINPQSETSEEGVQQFGDAFQTGKNEIFPIPENEVDGTNGLITQNPEY